MSFGRASIAVAVLGCSGCFSPAGVAGSATSSETTTTTESTSSSTAPTTTGTTGTTGTTSTTSTTTESVTSTEPGTSTEPVTSTEPGTDATTSDVTTVVPSMCGDGMVDAPLEQCDDGNLISGDGCDALCQIEQGPKPVRYVFLTSEVFTALQVGKLTAADETCTKLAGGAGAVPELKMRKFVAWLSDGAANASDRLGAGKTPYVRPDGMPVAPDADALTMGSLKNPINVTEKGQSIPSSMEPCAVSSDGVWTGTLVDGLGDGGVSCGGWQSDQGMGLIGMFDAVNATWTACAPRHCTEAFRLYCFEIE